MEELLELREQFDAMRGDFDSGFTGQQRELIARVSRRVLNKPVRKSGCRDCYRDAYIEIVKKLGELEKMPTLPDYILKAGVVYAVPCGSAVYVGANIPASVAEDWLRKNKGAIRFFQRYPKDWEARIEPGQGETPGQESPKPKTKSKRSKK